MPLMDTAGTLKPMFSNGIDEILEWCRKNSKEGMHKGGVGVWEPRHGAVDGLYPTTSEYNLSVLQSYNLGGKKSGNNEKQTNKQILELAVKELV